MLKPRRFGKPKTEAERRATHLRKFGTIKLPLRGTNLSAKVRKMKKKRS